jgi:D-alanine-D-alanine ligase
MPSEIDKTAIRRSGPRVLSVNPTKLKLAHAGLPTPEWSADGTGFDRDARVIAKAVWEHGSLGLDETSVVRCADAPSVVREFPRR